jgi:hypothetical protein
VSSYEQIPACMGASPRQDPLRREGPRAHFALSRALCTRTARAGDQNLQARGRRGKQDTGGWSLCASRSLRRALLCPSSFLLALGLVAGAGSSLWDHAPRQAPSLRGLLVLRGGGRPCKKPPEPQACVAAPRGNKGVKLALQILNVTLQDMERGRQMGLCGDEIPVRECMVCAGTNVRFGVTWEGITQIGMGAVHAQSVRHAPSNHRKHDTYSPRAEDQAFAYAGGDAAQDVEERPGADVGEGVDAGPGTEGSRGAAERRHDESSRHAARAARRDQGSTYARLWAVFLCRPCAAGTRPRDCHLCFPVHKFLHRDARKGVRS